MNYPKQIWSSQNFYGSMNTHENMNVMVSTLHLNNTNLTFTGVKTQERGLSLKGVDLNSCALKSTFVQVPVLSSLYISIIYSMKSLTHKNSCQRQSMSKNWPEWRQFEAVAYHTWQGDKTPLRQMLSHCSHPHAWSTTPWLKNNQQHDD